MVKKASFLPNFCLSCQIFLLLDEFCYWQILIGEFSNELKVIYFFTYTVDALAGRVVADLLEVDRVDGAGDLLLAPEPPRRLLKEDKGK